MTQGPPQPTIPVTCQCGRRFQAKAQFAGKRLKCPGCGQAIHVPQAETIPLTDLLPDDPLGGSPLGLGTPAGPAGGQLLHTTPAYGRAQPGESGGNPLLWIALAGGAAVVLLLAGGVIWLMSGSKTPPVAAGPGSTATTGGSPPTPGQPAPGAITPGDAKPSAAPGTATPGSSDVRPLFSLPQGGTTMLIPNVGYCQFVVADGQLFDLKTGAALGKCEHSDKYGVPKTVSPDGKYYAYEDPAGTESVVTVVAFPGGEKKHSLKLDKDKAGRVGALLSDQQGRLIAVTNVGRDSRVLIWNLADGQPVKEFDTTGRADAGKVTVDASGKRLALATNSDLRLYDIAAGKAVAELAVPSGAMGKSYFIYLTEPVFSPDGQELAGVLPDESGRGKRVIVWDATGPIKQEHPLALQIGGAYNYARPIQYTADGGAWLLHGDFLYDRKLEAITWILRIPPLAAYFPRPFLDADHVLGARGRSGARELVSVKLPRAALRAGAEALTSGKEALLKPGDTVSISVEVGDTRFADKAGVATQLQELLTKRLLAGGLKVGPNAPLAMTLKYSESQGQQLNVVSSPGPFAKPTGQTVQETVVVLDAKLFHQATKTVLWERAEKRGNPHMISGSEISDQAVRKQTFDMVQYVLSSMSIPYYVSTDPKAPTLPIITEL